MPQYKTGTALNLLSVKADIEDSSFLSSAYFVISDFDGSFGLGKNSIIINSPPTDIKIEAYDKLNTILYYEKAVDVDFIKKSQSIIVSFHVYSQNSPGIGKLILTGTFNNKLVRYITTVNIDNSIINKSKVRFYSPPTIEVTPLLVFATQTNITEVNPKTSTGSFYGKSIYPTSNFIISDNKYDKKIIDYQLTSTNNYFTSSFEGFSIVLNVNKIKDYNSSSELEVDLTSSILVKSVLNSTVLKLDTPFITKNTVNNKNVVSDIISGSYSILYSDYNYTASLFTTASYLTQSVEINGNRFKKYSVAEITYNNLDTFSGTVIRHKVYRRSLNFASDYSLVADELFADNEILKNYIVPVKSYQNLGNFYAKDFIDLFWFTSSVQMNLLQDSTKYINSMNISGSNINDGYIMVKLNTSASNRNTSYIPYDEQEYINQSGKSYDSNFIKFNKNNDYIISFNCNLLSKNSNSIATLDLYLTGSTDSIRKELTFNEQYGVKLVDFIINDNSTNKNFSNLIQYKFSPKNDLYGTLVIVPRGFNSLILGNLSIKLDKTVGFSPTSYTARIPFNVDQNNELFDIKSELYDKNSNLVYSNLRAIHTFDPSGSSTQAGTGDFVLNNLTVLGNVNLSNLPQVAYGRYLVLSGSGTGTSLGYL